MAFAVAVCWFCGLVCIESPWLAGAAAGAGVAGVKEKPPNGFVCSGDFGSAAFGAPKEKGAGALEPALVDVAAGAPKVNFGGSAAAGVEDWVVAGATAAGVAGFAVPGKEANGLAGADAALALCASVVLAEAGLENANGLLAGFGASV